MRFNIESKRLSSSKLYINQINQRSIINKVNCHISYLMEQYIDEHYQAK